MSVRTPTYSIFLWLVLALATPVTTTAQPGTINVATGDVFRFDVRVVTESSDSVQAAAEFTFEATEAGADAIGWRHAITAPRFLRNGANAAGERPLATATQFSVGRDGRIAAPSRYGGPWGDSAVNALAALGFTERHFLQLFFLQAAFATHAAGDTWSRRRDDTAASEGGRIEQHYTVNFAHEGAVDTLGRRTIRIRFTFAVESITFSGRPRAAHGALTVGGTIGGVAYYDTRDGLVVAFLSHHDMRNTETGNAATGAAQRLRGSVEIVRKE